MFFFTILARAFGASRFPISGSERPRKLMYSRLLVVRGAERRCLCQWVTRRADLDQVFTSDVASVNDSLERLLAGLRAKFPSQGGPSLHVADRTAGSHDARLHREVHPRIGHRVSVDIGH